MNRHQRRIARAQQAHKGVIQLRDGAYTIEEAGALALKERNSGNAQAAVDICNLILGHTPRSPDILNLRGAILQGQGRFADALESYDNAISISPDYADGYINRGAVLQEMARYEEALASCDQAIALCTERAEVYYNRGNVLQSMNQLDEAVASYDKAITLRPDYVEAHINRGSVLQGMKRFGEALASYRKAMTLAPDAPYLVGDVLTTQMYLSDWSGIEELIQRLLNGLDAGRAVLSQFVVTPLSPGLQKQCAERYIHDKYPIRDAKLWNGEKYEHGKIRLGYFSADLWNHATAQLMAGVFELHDRSRFEVTAFSFGPPSTDAMRMRLEKAFDRFIDVRADSDLTIATLARALEIDIAIDLKGLTRGSRPGIFALRPAPIQVNYLGHPGTMGASYIDYLIADAIVIPEEYRRDYTEKIAYLPYSYQANDSTRKISIQSCTRQEMGLPAHGFVFCCFNNNYKITPDVFDIWMRLLQNVAGSVLWLYVDDPIAAAHLRDEASSRGVSGHRMVFAERMSSADHLARHALADLFLDTFYCNAHTTASDALWAGLPVLTRLGGTFAGRVAASLLNAIGLPELITHSHAEYEARALELATNPRTLDALRQKLAQKRTRCPLFDTRLFTTHIELAYMKMWKNSQAGRSPTHLYVGASSE